MKEDSLLDISVLFAKAIATRYTAYAIPAGILCAGITFLTDWLIADKIFGMRRYVGAFGFVMMIGYMIGLWHIGLIHANQRDREID